MTELIALLSSGKGTWAEVAALIKSMPWEKVFLITDGFGKEKFHVDEKSELIVVDFTSNVFTLRNELKEKLKGKINDLEVALHLGSGNGKEHMALLSALLGLGIGFRLVTIGQKGFEEL